MSEPSIDELRARIRREIIALHERDEAVRASRERQAREDVTARALVSAFATFIPTDLEIDAAVDVALDDGAASVGEVCGLLELLHPRTAFDESLPARIRARLGAR